MICAGTWIPLERGVNLSKQYGCDHLLRPIIEFQPAAKSPPLAPKHLATSSTAANHATSTRPTRRAAAVEPPPPAPTINTRSSRKIVVEAPEPEPEREPPSPRVSDDGTMTPSPSEASSISRTPSPINSPRDTEMADDVYRNPIASHSHFRRLDEQYDEGSDNGEYKFDGPTDPRTYSDQILEYFISDTNQIPQVLINPPPDFDPNMAIDDDGHTPLHWACAMGRTRIVKLLLSAGADIFKVNRAGQTALMRSVMFANNYDVRKFPELYELLHRSTLNIDNYNRTVFHHVVDVALSKGKTHASRYYMESILQRLSSFPKELADIINFQDEDGETALTLAARCRSKRLVKLLIDYGADPKIANHDGKSTEDYILEDERFRSSPTPTSRLLSMPLRNLGSSSSVGGAPTSNSQTMQGGDRSTMHYSAAAQNASTRVVTEVAVLLDSLATAFDQELREKEKDIAQAHALFANIQGEILESQRTVAQLKTQSEGLESAEERLARLEDELQKKMGRRYRVGFEKWIKGEEAKEQMIRGSTVDGSLLRTPSPKTQADVDMDDIIRLDPDGGEDMNGDTKPRQNMEGLTLDDLTELQHLYSDIPTDVDTFQQAYEATKEEILGLRMRRRDMFHELVSFQAEAGTSGRMAEYRRLIGAGCGGIPPAEVDNVLGMLLEVGPAPLSRQDSFGQYFNLES